MIPEPIAQWLPGIVTAVTDFFLLQVQGIMETVKQMDNALQRRSKLRQAAQSTPGGTNIMSDSEKITLQLLLDAKALGQEISSLGVAAAASYETLLAELADAEKYLAK